MEVRKFAPAAALTLSLLAGACTSEEAPTPAPETPLQPYQQPEAYVHELQSFEVACTNLDGAVPFTEESCNSFANGIEAGLADIPHLTGNVIKAPRVTHHIYDIDLKILDLIETRCTNFINGTEEEFGRLNNLVTTISNAALRQVKVDFDTTGLHIVTNLPSSVCKVPQSPSESLTSTTERCPAKTDSKGDAVVTYGNGRAMIEAGEPIIFFFGNEGPEKTRRGSRHERIHFARKDTRIGHDFALCSKNSDSIPANIGRTQPDLTIDQYTERGSIMSYARNSDYLAVPHLAYMDIFGEDRIVTPEESGTFTLGDIQSNDPAAIVLPLTNPAITSAIRPLVSPGQAPLDARRLWIGKLPGKEVIGIYAAPSVADKYGVPAIVLIDTITPGQTIHIEGDVYARAIKDKGAESVKVSIQLP